MPTLIKTRFPLAFDVRVLASFLALAGFAPCVWSQDDFEREPILYSSSQPVNAVEELRMRLDKGEAKLEFDSKLGYLPSFLKAIDAPVSSQCLVFSKTSLQRRRISPSTPRAIYFSDDAYVGYCHNGDVLEVAIADPELGTVFYTIDQEESVSPKILRQNENCLICHGSSQTNHVPGHLIRSVFTDRSGEPLHSWGGSRVDQTTPLDSRFGGWYITGHSGAQTHYGNFLAKTRDRPQVIENENGINLSSLESRFRTGEYLSGHSDIVAHLVLTHQTMTHNAITKASFQTRQALHLQESLNRELGEPEDHEWPSTVRRIESACESLVQCLLFAREAPLTERIRGTTEFEREFVARGPFSRDGKSLREFDLQRRLFRYPCSFLIYSKSFELLPKRAKIQVLNRLNEITSGKDQSSEYAHLGAADRQAIRSILSDTLPEFAAIAR